MKQETNSDSETSWDLSKKIFAMAWPNILYALLDRSMGLVDMWLAGDLSADAIAAVGLSQQILFLIIILTIALTSGAMPLIGQHLGNKNMSMVKHCSAQILRGMVLCSFLLIPLLFFFAGPMLRLLKGNEEVVRLGLDYLQPMALGLTFVFINFTMVILFRSVGRVRTPLLVLLLMLIVNVPVSYFLLKGVEGLIPAMGMSGIAIGTITGRLIGTVLLIVIWLKIMKKEETKSSSFLDMEFFKQVLSIGLPIALMNFVRSGAQVVFFTIFAGISSVALAATSITYQLRMLLLMSTLMIHQALITLVSQSLGEGDKEKAKRYVWQTQLWANILMGVVAVVMIFFSEDVVRGICSLSQQVDSAALVETSSKMIRIALCAQIFITLAIVFGAALTAGGDVKMPFVFTCISEWVIMIPCAFILANYYADEPHLIWYAFVISPFFLTLCYYHRFRQNKWQNKLV
ncbi:MAG: MATE family efflux transporter [Lentisphaeria bacterium]|nr:MATE family efflux transporter [Lentisphaeria bacterium]